MSAAPHNAREKCTQSLHMCYSA